jgi:hypothetical protein
MVLAFVTVWCTVYLLFVCICLCVDIVHVSSEHPIGDDQEEPVYEEEDTQFVEKASGFPPLHILFEPIQLHAYTMFTILVAMH